MKKILLISVTAICLTNFPLAAQNNPTPEFLFAGQNTTSTPAYAGGLFENFGVAFKVNSLGVGLDFMTALHPNIKVSVGCNYWNFIKLNINKDFDGTSIDGLKRDVPVHVDNISFDLLNGNLLVDFFPWRKLGFHLTLGAYVGKIDIPANASASEAFEVEGYAIRPNANGKFKATLRLGNVVKPYFGIGFGRTIPQKPVGFKFDFGIMYQGPYKIISDNMDTSSISDEAHSWVDKLGIPKILTEIYPVMSFSLIYRIK